MNGIIWKNLRNISFISYFILQWVVRNMAIGIQNRIGINIGVNQFSLNTNNFN
jgi:hypothetical protein